MIAAEVEIAKDRSGWPVRRTLRALGLARATYYRQQSRTGAVRRARPVVVAEALPEERAAVEAFARRHPELRHRALAWTALLQNELLVFNRMLQQRNLPRLISDQP